MEKSIPLWQIFFLSSILSWLFISSYLNLTQKLRSVLQPPITRQVYKSTPFILRIQSFQHGSLDAFFSVLSCVVSVPFYTAFLPLLFWSGHCKLARQMTLLMAFCDYIGNLVKDLISAPRPQCPPVRRITATKEEKENAMEYGLPSSHTLNTVCLSGYLLHYILSYSNNTDVAAVLFGVTIVCVLVGLIGTGRIYLGMHSLVDIIGGVVLGLLILAFWLIVHEYVDSFIICGQNVTSFWASLAFLLLFAYPTPKNPTPSFEFHAAFNGVALGVTTQFRIDSTKLITFWGSLKLVNSKGHTFIWLELGLAWMVAFKKLGCCLHIALISLFASAFGLILLFASAFGNL